MCAGQDWVEEHLAGILVKPSAHPPNCGDAAPDVLRRDRGAPPAVHSPEHNDVALWVERPVGVVGVPTEPVFNGFLGPLSLLIK